MGTEASRTNSLCTSTPTNEFKTVNSIPGIAGPQNVRVLNATSNSVTISWSNLSTPPGFTLDSFQVVANPVSSYSTNSQPYEGTTSAQKNSFMLLGLAPATRYNISIWGETADKNSTDKSFVEAWTLIGGEILVD